MNIRKDIVELYHNSDLKADSMSTLANAKHMTTKSLISNAQKQDETCLKSEYRSSQTQTALGSAQKMNVAEIDWMSSKNANIPG